MINAFANTLLKNKRQNMTETAEHLNALGTRCMLCGSSNIETIYPLEEFSVVQCRDCTLVFLRMDMKREDMEALYGSSYYEERHEYFFASSPDNPGSENETTDSGILNFRKGLKLLESHAPEKGKLLDVGCAVGIFLDLAHNSGWEVSGTDISHYAVSYCRDKLGFDVRCGAEISSLGFAEESFDVVTLWDVLEHFENPLDQLRQVHRLVKKGGVILIDTPNEKSILRSIARMIYRLTNGRWNYPVHKLYHKFHLYYFSPDTLRTLLEDSGFELIHLEGRPIPSDKGRAGALGRLAVKIIAWPEKLLQREFELVAIAKKV